MSLGQRRGAGFVTIERVESRRGGKVALVLGDGRTITAPADVVADSGLAEGMAASEHALASLDAQATPGDVHQAALKLLRFRPRNERDLRTRLVAKGYDRREVEGEIARLREVGLLDDRAFAAAFVEERARRSPKGKRLVQMELAARGVERQLAAEAAAAIDEPALALELARKRLRKGMPVAYDDYQARTGPFLLRRGFGIEVARSAMRQAWDEGATGAGAP